MRKSGTRNGNANYFKKGSYNVISDYSGFKIKAENSKMTWDGFRVAIDEWEPRHPQDFTATARDKQFVPNARPVAPYIFTDLDYNFMGTSDDDFLLLSNNTVLETSNPFEV
jgi:hypothetical protein